ncbi:RDD family protein [Pseudomonadota bacterium]
MLDTRYPVETPEGVELSLCPAGLLSRGLAFAVDWLIRVAVVITLFYGLSLLGVFGFGLAMIVYFLVEWFYPVFFELLRQGVTPGKKGFNLQVMKVDGTPITFSDSIIRNLLRAADFLPFMYVAGICSMVLTKRFQRLGDLAAGTVVVYTEPKQSNFPEIEDEAKTNMVSLSMEERGALIEFSERSATISKDRLRELAGILEPMLGADEDEAVVNIRQIAKGYMGQA